jgi:hypothetical protein
MIFVCEVSKNEVNRMILGQSTQNYKRSSEHLYTTRKIEEYIIVRNSP